MKVPLLLLSFVCLAAGRGRWVRLPNNAFNLDMIRSGGAGRIEGETSELFSEGGLSSGVPQYRYGVGSLGVSQPGYMYGVRGYSNIPGYRVSYGRFPGYLIGARGYRRLPGLSLGYDGRFSGFQSGYTLPQGGAFQSYSYGPVRGGYFGTGSGSIAGGAGGSIQGGLPGVDATYP